MDKKIAKQMKKDLKRFEQESSEANQALLLQIEEQNQGSMARAAKARKDAAALQSRAAKVAKAQIKGSYRATALRSGAPGPRAAGVQVTKRVASRRPREPLQIMTGDTFQT